MRAGLSVFCCFKLVLTATLLNFAAGAVSPASAQSTAFTYQGSLDDAGAPASGLHDFRFRLFSVASGGTPIGSTLCVDNVSVVEGVFTVQLDFGPQFATTEQRHLEIEVRRDTGLACGSTTGFVVMAPRQEINVTPMAIHSNSAFSLDAADGSPTNAVFVDNGGNVGIGTTTPATKLHVKTDGEGLRIDGSSVGAPSTAWVGFRDSNGTRTGYVGDGGGSDNSVYLTSDAGDVHLYTAVGAAVTAKSDGKVGIGTTLPRSSLHVNGQCVWLTGGNGGGLPIAAGSGLRLYHDGSRGMVFAFDYATASPRDLCLQEPGGNVGIGTTSPAAKLDVRGDIRLGSSGELRAASGDENLRIVRGVVNFDGAILAGSGFDVTRQSTGVYAITFSTAFTSLPAFTALVVDNNSGPAIMIHARLLASGSVTVHISNTSGAPFDWDFSFTAIGPR